MSVCWFVVCFFVGLLVCWLVCHFIDPLAVWFVVLCWLLVDVFVGCLVSQEYYTKSTVGTSKKLMENGS